MKIGIDNFQAFLHSTVEFNELMNKLAYQNRWRITVGNQVSKYPNMSFVTHKSSLKMKTKLPFFHTLFQIGLIWWNTLNLVLLFSMSNLVNIGGINCNKEGFPAHLCVRLPNYRWKLGESEDLFFRVVLKHQKLNSGCKKCKYLDLKFIVSTYNVFEPIWESSGILLARE